jgi:hypothetical protein
VIYKSHCQTNRNRDRIKYLRFSLHNESVLGTGLPLAHGAEIHAHIQVEAWVTRKVGSQKHVVEGWMWIWKWLRGCVGAKVTFKRKAETRRARPSSALGGKAEMHRAEVMPNTG